LVATWQKNPPRPSPKMPRSSAIVTTGLGRVARGTRPGRLDRSARGGKAPGRHNFARVTLTED
jgi:hypothetical protein